MELFSLYLALGICAGLIAGLLGVGGGLIIVPVLVLLFQWQGMQTHYIMQLAVGSSLASVIITSLSSLNAHHRRGGVHWQIFWRMAPGIALGALLGALLAARLPGELLRRCFAVLELLVALQLAFDLMPSTKGRLPGRLGLLGAGGVIGSVSSALGIGGGTMTVPYLVWGGIRMREAVGTSAACGLPIALAGVTGYIIGGWQVTGLPAGSSGFVHWPAVLGIVLASVLSAPIGARLAYRLPAKTLQRIFALVLLMLGVKMWLG